MHTPTSLRTPLWLLSLPLALAAAWPAAGASERPLQTQKCNDPPPAFGAQGGTSGDVNGDGGLHTDVTGKALKPGTTRKTLGTDTILSPELDGFIVHTETHNFSFDGGQGGQGTDSVVAGTYTETIVEGTDKKCKCHLQVQVTTGCINKLAVHHYIHPKKLVADWRTDLSGLIRSKTASRTLAEIDGTTVVTFNLASNVCAGQTTKWLLLNTSVDEVELLGTLEFIAPTGIGSTVLFPFHVPYVP